ncbi:MAG: lipoyl(octanoyl) transferase LipB [Flavobacteriales bacterium]|nr:lipoyl(octanoyl) transferase LipB [Flavobacteriales bacterium]
MNKTVIFQDLGTKDYGSTWKYQKELFQKTIDVKMDNRHTEKDTPTENYLLFVEHPHVYTLGRQGKEEHLLLSPEKLKSEGVSFYHIDRGGDITYHGPGQLVGYPIIDLDSFSPDIHLYMRNLEEVIIRTIADFDIKGMRSNGETGVWLDAGTPFARKICAMGVRTSHWVTMHGFALNVNTDMRFFSGIIPCGIRGKGVTSIANELKKDVPLQQVKERVLHHFSDVFSAEIKR